MKECPKHGLTEHVIVDKDIYKCKACRINAVESTRRKK